jgi:uncharacterized delta-60 repeat protein
MVKDIMKKFTSPGPWSLLGKTGFLTLGLMVMVVLTANIGRAQFSFATAQGLSGDSGSVVNDNTTSTNVPGAPSIAGFPPNHALWYAWTASHDGEVELDTVNSGFQFLDFDAELDTVLGVYTGTTISGLNQVAANDDLFPISTVDPQLNESGSPDYLEGGAPGTLPLFTYDSPYNGPSHLRFNAQGGVTYYFAVDTKANTRLFKTGPTVLTWAYQSSGVLRFATEDFDFFTGLPLYQTSQTESAGLSGTANDVSSADLTYYTYNVPGTLVTVTRAAGSVGRISVDYTTVDGNQIDVGADLPAYGLYTNITYFTNLDGSPGTNSVGAILPPSTNILDGDYSPVSGTLIFDDYEMSKTILIPIGSGGGEAANPFISTNLVIRGQSFGNIQKANNIANQAFGVVLSNPQLDPFESSEVSAPRVDLSFNTALVRILNSGADPYGPDLIPVVITNAIPVLNTNPPPILVTNFTFITNMVVAAFPTNPIFNFEKANYRVPADVNSSISPWTYVALYVERFGTNSSAETINYRVNNFLGNDGDASEEQNILFPLQPASDYAVPTPPTQGVVRGAVSEFVLTQGTISFPATGPGANLQKITFTVPTSSLTKFNKDFKVQIYRNATVNGHTVPELTGMNCEATVTILTDDQVPPAGAVDEVYNADFNRDLALPTVNVPITVPQNDQNPGPSGQVNGIALLPNDEAVVVGDFPSYNGFLRECVTLVATNGLLDTSFNPGQGANGAILAVAMTANNEIVIGGAFSAFNNSPSAGVALLTTNGLPDPAFNPGNGADGVIRAVAVQSDGKILIGGDFTHYNNFPRNYIARLNANGSLDTTFNAGATLSGSVYTIAAPSTIGGINPTGAPGIMVGGSFSVAGQIYNNVACLNTNGTLNTAFNPGVGADDLVQALGYQSNGQIVAGGVFTHMNHVPLNHLVRFNADGSLDTTNFFTGIGADGIVYNVNVQTNGAIYIGGNFGSYNGTHRLGFARLNTDGTLDTTFLDTTYNQFAGLKRIYSTDLPTVFASAIQSSGGVLIGGSFDQVGGGQADLNVFNSLDDELGYTESFGDSNLWVEPKTRDGVRNRSNFARLIGGSTPGPGNISFLQTSYQANKTQTALTVSLVRTNGNLGPMAANFSIAPGLAQSGLDYIYNSTPPLYWIVWDYLSHPSRQRSDGLNGQNEAEVDPFGLFLSHANADSLVNIQSGVSVTIRNNKATSGNLSALFQLANPSGADTFYLGGENIPVGGALGETTSPFTLVDNNQTAGTFGFSTPVYLATNSTAAVTLLRSNGNFGTVTLKYSTTNGTALAGIDYIGLTNITASFASSVFTNIFNVTIIGNGVIYTNPVEKFFGVKISSLTGQAGASLAYGISNAVVRLVNPNFQGYLTLSSNSYTGNESAGFINFTVNRVSGSLGTISVQYSTTNGTAVSGTDYLGTTNHQLIWNSGDSQAKTISLPLINIGAVSGDKQFGVVLFNPTNGATAAPSLMGLVTNATMTIHNDNSYGTLQFSTPVYTVNENGGYATLTATRGGGSAGLVSVNYKTGDSNAVSGKNYFGTNGVLVLTTNQISATFTVQITNDLVVDPPPSNFTFSVTLYNPTNAALGSLSNAVVQIVDAQTFNLPPGSPDLGFSPITAFNGSVLALALQSNGQILAGGNFTQVGGSLINDLARLGTDGSLDTAFMSGNATSLNGAVEALADQTDDRIIVAGAFTSIDGAHQNYLVRLMNDGSLDSTFSAGSGADSPVNAVTETFIGGARYIYVGGGFGNYNSSPSPGLVRVHGDEVPNTGLGGSIDTSFATGLGFDAPVFCVTVYPTNSPFAGKVLVGGSFTRYNANIQSYLIRLNVDGTVDTNYVVNLGSGPNGPVHAMVVQSDGRVVLGGAFTAVNGTFLNNLARLNTDGTLDTNFTANAGVGANGTVEAMALQTDGRIMVAGQFTQANGVTRNHVTRLLASGATDPTINFGDGANGDVDALLVQPSNGMLVLGGGFSQFNDQPHANIVRIYGGSQTGSGQFEFTSADYQVNENGVTAVVTVRRTGGTSGTNPDGSGVVSVNFNASDGSAKAGTNYVAVSTTLNFPAGEVLQSVPISILDDDVITPDLTNNLALSNPTPPATLGSQPTATLHILNSDNAVSFSSTFYSQVKNVPNGLAAIDVIRQGGTNTISMVDFYTTTNGTAIANLDYTPIIQTLTFNPGQADIQVQIPISNNGLIEGNRTVGLILTNAVNTLLLAPSNAVLTIVDTAPAPGQLLFDHAIYNGQEGNPNVTLTVLRTNSSSQSPSISVAFITVPGTAQPAVNYTAITGTLSFGIGETNKTIILPLTENNLVQGTVNMSVVLTNPTPGVILLTPSIATVSIADDDVGLAFLNGTNFVSETNNIGSILVARVGLTNNAVSAQYFTTNGTAFAGTNYTAVSGTLNFIPGETLKAITLPLIDNPKVTGNLVMSLRLSNISAGASLVAPSNTLVVIQDGDAGLSFTNSTTTVSKGASLVVIPVICSDTNVALVSVNYSTADGTAVANTHYIPVSGTLSFSNGVTTNYFVVPLINNGIIDSNRTFTVSLSNPTPPGQVVAPGTQTVTIVEDQTGFNFSSSIYTILRNGGVQTNIVVNRLGNTNSVSTVAFSAGNGSGVAGLDYVPTNGVLVFTNGVTTESFVVPVIANTTVQPDKTVLLQLFNPSNSILTPPSAATLTIHDTSGSLVVAAGSALTSESFSPPNGLIDPGETVTLLFALRASGGTNIPGVKATLLATNGVTSPSPASQNYGSLVVNGPSISKPFSFTANGSNSQIIAATLLLNNGVTNIGTAVFTYTLGVWTNTFYSTNVITIVDNAAANPYPSAINVSGVGGTLIKATATVTNMSHPSPSDIDILLVDPAQQDTLLMSHAGAQFTIQGITLTFDDASTNSLPQNALITSGTNKPTAYGSLKSFP